LSVKIAAGICTYSDSLGLARCLESLAGQVEPIVIHGPYPSYTRHDPFSFQETSAVCKAYPNTRLIDLPEPLPEIQRRQLYLDNANNYDFLLVIDSDEYIVEANWSKFKDNLQTILLGKHFYIYDIMFAGHPSQAGPRPRLFRDPSKIRYYKKHYWWHLPTDRIAAGASDSCQIVDGIKLMWDDTLRSEDRKKAKEEYQQQLLQDESRHTISNRELTGSD
jgi:hypothetical protein